MNAPRSLSSSFPEQNEKEAKNFRKKKSKKSSILLSCHFLQYMGETSRPWIERIFWMVAFIISTIGCALLIAEMFEKLQTNPITVSLAERPSSIQEVNEPF